jgi:hypothetical protein
VTENPVVALCATSAITAAAVHQFNTATLQICRKWVREQRPESIERDWVTPDRPREPILAILAMEASRAKPAVNSEAGKKRKGLGSKENGPCDGSILVVILWRFIS